MAIGKVNVVVEREKAKIYTGVGSFFLVSVNPSKAELDKLYGYDNKEPEYVTEQDGVKSARVTFILKSDPEKNNGIEVLVKHSFFLRNEPKKGSQSGKVQIVDSYGNFAWATPEEAQEKKIPVYGNGQPATIAEDYRIAYVGEEELTDFVKKFCGISSPLVWEDGVCKGFKTDEDLTQYACRLDKISEYFKGNFKELKDIKELAPASKVKILLGVQTSDKGQFQVTYTKKAMGAGNSNYSQLEKSMRETLSQTTKQIDYTGDNNKSSLGGLKEYVPQVVVPKPKDEADDLPFGNDDNSDPFAGF